MRISPLSGWTAPVMTLMSVDLPAPFSPTIACTSPARSSNETSSSARTPGYDLVMLTACSSGMSGISHLVIETRLIRASAFLGQALLTRKLSLSGPVEQWLKFPHSLIWHRHWSPSISWGRHPSGLWYDGDLLELLQFPRPPCRPIGAPVRCESCGIYEAHRTYARLFWGD